MTQPRRQYVSTGDHHALAHGQTTEEAEDNSRARTVAYRMPTVEGKRSAGNMAVPVLRHSLAGFLLLIAARWLSRWLGGAVAGRSLLGGSMSEAWIGCLIIVIAKLAVVTRTGYRVSPDTGESGKGWIYGPGCVAPMIFAWQGLPVLILELAGARALASMFNFVLMPVASLPYLPMGARGGWIAEKSYVG